MGVSEDFSAVEEEYGNANRVYNSSIMLYALDFDGILIWC